LALFARLLLIAQMQSSQAQRMFIFSHLKRRRSRLRIGQSANRYLALAFFGLQQTSKSATDAANNAYVKGISDKDWVHDTLMRLRSKDLDNTQ